MSTDHKAEAEISVERVTQWSGEWTDAQRDTELRLAQVHATLYLAEQQRVANEHARIANLIALVGLRGASSIPAVEALVEVNELGTFVAYRPDIARLLGLGGEGDE